MDTSRQLPSNVAGANGAMNYGDAMTLWEDERRREHEKIAEAEMMQLLRVQKVTAIMIKWLEVDPIRRNRTAILAKTFIKWAKVFPIYQKCDELASQLMERNEVVTSFRESYLRDVISIKYHLEKIGELKTSDGVQAASVDMYGLSSVPSTDLRSLIDRAQQAVNPTSLQLTETLLQAGIYNAAGKDLNPWEKSKSYRRGLLSRLGSDSSIPKDGRSFPLFAPRNHRLFIRYCSDCIGFMNFVRDWNREVEESISLKLEGKALIQQTNLQKTLINDLNDIIVKQESDMIALQKELDRANDANAWFEKWKSEQKYVESEAYYKVKLEAQRNNLAMAQADKESTAANVHWRHLQSNTDMKKYLNSLQDQIRTLKMEKELEHVGRLDLMDRLQKIQGEFERKSAEVTRLERKVQEISETHAHLETKTSVDRSALVDLSNLVKFKEKEAEQCRIQLQQDTEAMQLQIEAMSAEYAAKEAQVDEIRSEIRHLKQERVKDSAIISNLVKFMPKRKLRYIQYLAGESKTDGPKLSFRALAIAVLMCIRVTNAIRTREWIILGSAVGTRRVMADVVQEQRQIVEALNQKEEEVKELRVCNFELRDICDTQTNELNALREALEEEKLKCAGMLTEIAEKEKRCSELIFETEALEKAYSIEKTEMTIKHIQDMRRAAMCYEFERSLVQRLLHQAEVNPDHVLLGDEENVDELRQALEEERAHTTSERALQTIKRSITMMLKWREHKKKDHKLLAPEIPKPPPKRAPNYNSGPSPDHKKVKPNLVARAPIPYLFLRSEEMADIFKRDESQVEKVMNETLYDVNVVETCVSSMRIAHNKEIKSHLRNCIHLEKHNVKLMEKVMGAVDTLVRVKAGVTRIADVNISDFDYLDVFQESDEEFDEDENEFNENNDDVHGQEANIRDGAGSDNGSSGHNRGDGRLDEGSLASESHVQGQQVAGGPGLEINDVVGEGSVSSLKGDSTLSNTAKVNEIDRTSAPETKAKSRNSIRRKSLIKNTTQMQQLAEKRRTFIATLRTLESPSPDVQSAPKESSKSSSSKTKSQKRAPHFETKIVADEFGNQRIEEVAVLDSVDEESDDENWNPGNDLEAVLHSRQDAMKTALDSVAHLEHKLLDAKKSEDDLLSRIEEMMVEIATLRLKAETMEEERNISQQLAEESAKDYTDILEETRVLRKACEDSYRVQNTEVDRVLQERDEMEKRAAAARASSLRNKGTQLACCVCAVREPYRPPAAINILTASPVENPKPRPKSPSETINKITSIEPTDTDVVLVARPRKINEIFIFSDSVDGHRDPSKTLGRYPGSTRTSAKPIPLSALDESVVDLPGHAKTVLKHRLESTDYPQISSNGPVHGKGGTHENARSRPTTANAKPTQEVANNNVAMKIIQKIQAARPNSAISFRPGKHEVGLPSGTGVPLKPDIQSEYPPNNRLRSIVPVASASIVEQSSSAKDLLERTTYIPTSVTNPHLRNARPSSSAAAVSVSNQTASNASKFSILRSIPAHVSPSERADDAYNAMNKSAINRVAAYIQHNIIEELEQETGPRRLQRSESRSKHNP